MGGGTHGPSAAAASEEALVPSVAAVLAVPAVAVDASEFEGREDQVDARTQFPQEFCAVLLQGNRSCSCLCG